MLAVVVVVVAVVVDASLLDSDALAGRETFYASLFWPPLLPFLRLFSSIFTQHSPTPYYATTPSLHSSTRAQLFTISGGLISQPDLES
ncbi:hypothetical protein E2C01_055460 [Portunus trituberculatus]|uniref:Secreted protein n=1 Tax=Portunus trituberculatus TaxID=210409 RepID=A0A5B7GWW3_PORTR|nr:hypothetical protein [Portunus trituberculatus]